MSYADCGVEWREGQVVRMDKQRWEEAQLTPQGLIPEGGVYLSYNGKLYIYRGQDANL